MTNILQNQLKIVFVSFESDIWVVL